MKKLLFIVLLMFVFVGCGSDDNSQNISVISEDAGTNCEAGGVKITVDSKVYYSCSGTHGTNGTNGTDGTHGTHGTDGKSPTITTEQVAVGHNDNPCEGPALKVTVVPADESEEPVVEYVCQAFDPVEDVFSDYISLMADSDILRGKINCECNSTDYGYSTTEECLEDMMPEYIKDEMVRCLNEASYRYGKPVPAVFQEFIVCGTLQNEALKACADAIPDDICTADNQTALEECYTTFHENVSECDLDFSQDEEFKKWDTGMEFFINRLQCNF